MNSKERVKKAIKRQGPDQVPLLFAYSLQDSDVINVEVVRHFTGENRDKSEWGFEWARSDESLVMGKPKRACIMDWEDLADFRAPDPYDETRFDKIRTTREKYGDDRYYKANFILSGFSVMTMLRGFSSLMEDLYLDRENVEKLADVVFGFEEDVIRQAARHGYDAIGLADDWGTQSGLLISPDLWREIFKPRYARQIELAHRCGLDVYLHSCGYIYDIVGDLVEIGLDIINPGQPDINDVVRLGRDFGGKICFACPVSYQTTGVSGSRDDIFRQVRDYVANLGCFTGGLIGIIPEDSKGLGLTQEKLDAMTEAFRLYGNYSTDLA
jgi:uroporphyrinogen decarboxylase